MISMSCHILFHNRFKSYIVENYVNKYMKQISFNEINGEVNWVCSYVFRLLLDDCKRPATVTEHEKYLIMTHWIERRIMPIVLVHVASNTSMF